MQDPSTIILGPYRFNPKYCLGQGSFGKVYKGTRISDNLPVAIKQLDTSIIDQKAIINECNLLKNVKHPNIVEMYEIIEREGYCYLIIEHCNGGDLAEFLGENSEGEGVSELEAQDIFFQICQGFVYLKQFNIIHRDLKPNNIMVHNKTYKIADFGLAKTENLQNGAMTKTHVGSPIYMAPQILSKNYYTGKCDVWSLGVIFFELLFGELPWKTGEMGNILFKIMESPNPHLGMKRKVGEVSRMLLEGTLRYLEKDRLTFQELLGFKKERSSKKKIFPSQPPTPTVSPLTLSHHINSQLDFNPFQYHKYTNDLQPYQKQVLKHIYSQLFSLKQQLTRLTSKYCFQIFITTCYNYMIQGSKKEQEFRDCCKIFLKMSSENMSLYVIDLESWEEGRDVLGFIQLVHDFAITRYGSYEEYQRAFERSMPAKIDIYAAVVISKINTYARANS